MTDKKMERFSPQVQKLDGNLAVIIPNKIVEQLNINEGTEVRIILEKQGIKIKKKPVLEELLDQVTEENQHDEVDWGKRMGKEVW